MSEHLWMMVGAILLALVFNLWAFPPNGEAQPPRGLKRRVSTTPQARRRRLLQ